MPAEKQTTPTSTKPLSSKDLQSLTVWDMQIAKTGQSLRQSAWAMTAAWVGSGVAGFIYWWKRSIQQHGAFTQSDWSVLPYLAVVQLAFGLIVVYLFFRNVLPTARRDLAKLQEQARAEDTHSSTTSPRC